MTKAVKKIVSRIQKRVILILYYGRKISFRAPEKRQVILCFDGNFAHGGLVDRIKGIISFYEAAKLTGRDFKIYFKDPFSLEDFLVPNQLDWRIEKIEYNPFSSTVLYLMDRFDVNPLELIKNSSADRFFVYANVDLLGKIHPEKSTGELQSLWRENYRTLFTPSALLQEELLKMPNANTVVFHSRFTSLMGDFEDTSKKSISPEKKQQLLEALLEKITSYAQRHLEKDVYVLSDSTIFLNYIKQNTGFKTLDGTPKHIDIRKNDANWDSHLKTFADFYFMVNARAVYLLKLDRMYNSGFSKYAAIVGDNDFEVIA